MTILNKYNKGNQFTFQTPEHFEYINLKELVAKYGIDQTHQVNVLYINTKSRYGDHGVAVTGTHIVNLPNHLTNTIKEMIADAEVVELANQHALGFKVYEYTGANGVGYSISWVDGRLER